MGVVKVYGRQLRQVVQVAVGKEVPSYNILHRGGNQEILLGKAQKLALGVVVLGIEDLGDDVGHGLLLHCPHIVAAAEEVHVELVVLRLPYPKQAYAPAVLAGHVKVIGHGGDGGIVLMLHGVVLLVPLLLDMSVKVHLHGVVGHRLHPYRPPRQPEVRQLRLPAVHQLLLEKAVFVPQRVAHGRIPLGGKAVQETGRKPPQAPVAKARVGLLVIEVAELYAKLRQSLPHIVLKAQVIEVVLQRAPQKELHAKIVYALCLRLHGVLLELRAALGHQLPDDKGHGLVILLVGGVLKGHPEGVGKLIPYGFLDLRYR